MRATHRITVDAYITYDGYWRVVADEAGWYDFRIPCGSVAVTSVEALPFPWTDGDIVKSINTGVIRWREKGLWIRELPVAVRLVDEEVDLYVKQGKYQVIRKQADL